MKVPERVLFGLVLIALGVSMAAFGLTLVQRTQGAPPIAPHVGEGEGD